MALLAMLAVTQQMMQLMSRQMIAEPAGISISHVQNLRNGLRAALQAWDAQLAKTPAGKRAGLLESLPAAAPASPRRSVPFSTNNNKQRRQTKQ